MARTPIDDLLATGTDELKLLRIRNLSDAEAPSAIQNALVTNDSKLALEGLRMYIDVALLSNSLSDATLRRQYNPITATYVALNTFRQILQMNPRIVSENQETAFPLLLAMGMLNPEKFAYEAAWHIVAEMDVVRDPHQRAAIGNRHLRFYAEDLSPFLFKEMFDARDRGDAAAYKNIGELWETNMQHMFLIHRSSATGIVKRRLRNERDKQTPDADKLALLNRMNVMFDHIDRLERERRLRLAQQRGESPVTAVFEEAGREVGALQRPDTTLHFTSGTPEGDALKRPDRAIKLLNKFRPPHGSQPH